MALQSGRYLIILFCCMTCTVSAQVVYYPANSSDLLKSTAHDVADVFTRAIPGSNYIVREYSTLPPQSGIIFYYDSSISADQVCKIKGSANAIQFSAAEDNGLCFGIYKYLDLLGFRFYLPGSIWEKIPSLNNPFQNIDTVVQGKIKYNTWNISGGHNRWAMDNDDSYGWDVYYGKNGHEWAKYQRRNNMNGSSRFSGHRGDILTPSYLNILQSNPCYVACYNQSRQAGMQSVPDINNTAAKDLWSLSIGTQFTNFRSIVNGNPILYSNYYHNFHYANGNIGIEVPDGARWGNSINNNNCPSGNYNGNAYPGESDQQFLLADYSAQKMHTSFTEKRFQCYAYAGHANIPSLSVGINELLDVQVIPGAFQFETSAKCLLNRWYNAHPFISEYHYLNIPQWTGETPIFSLDEFKNTWQRVKEKHAQGIIVEASPAKFGSLPFLFAGNRYLQDGKNIDSTLDEFVTSMFPADIAVHIRKLLSYFGDDNISTTGNYIFDNKYKIPLYLDELNKAVIAANGQMSTPEIAARLEQFKAYLHYLILYYDFITTPGSIESKFPKASVLCNYLARINKLQLVNSFYLIQDIVSKFPPSHLIRSIYNVNNGTTYDNGNLPLITSAEINDAFIADVNQYLPTVSNYKFEVPSYIIGEMDKANVSALDSIHVKIGYTNGLDYPNRSEFYFYAASAGSIAINCHPQFEMPNGYINISVEAEDKTLVVLKDETITVNSNPGLINIDIPSGGIYKISIVSKYRSTADLIMYTRGNLFYKKGAFYGDKVESYRYDTTSFPTLIHIPAGIEKLYFSVNNACYNNCLSGEEVSEAFAIRDNQNQLLTVNKSPTDPSLFYINILNPNEGKFWKVSKMREYNLCFSNISNIELFAGVRDCKNIDFSAEVISFLGQCHTRITANTEGSHGTWQIKDGSGSYNYTENKVVDLPILLSPNGIIQFISQNGCKISKKASSIPGYLHSISACSSSAEPNYTFLQVYPNPSSGIFSFKMNNIQSELIDIRIYGGRGALLAQFKRGNQVDLSSYPSGVYILTGSTGKNLLRFKLVKM